MRVESAFLRSRVGRRIFFLFVGCALVPILALAIVSYYSVTRDLKSQSEERLHELSKAQGMAVLERLSLLSSELELEARNLVESASDSRYTDWDVETDLDGPRFTGLRLVNGSGEILLEDGNTLPVLPELELEQRQHLKKGRALLVQDNTDPTKPELMLARALQTENLDAGVLWAGLNPLFVWWGSDGENSLPAMMELFIFNPSRGTIIFSSLPSAVTLPPEAIQQLNTESRGYFGWELNGTRFLARHRLFVLRHSFLHPGLSIILSESEQKMLGPLADFKRTFPLILLITLWVVLLLATSQIRRSLVPLEKLQEGTRRISGREFDTRVEIDSGDEFEQLGDSFNAMAGDLGRQFNALATMNEIVQAVLSALDTETIVGATLSNVNKIVPCTHVSITLLDIESGISGRTFEWGVGVQSDREPLATELTSDDLSQLQAVQDYLLLEVGVDCPAYLKGLHERGIRSALVLPIRLQAGLAAILAAGFKATPELREDALEQSRQLADQVAVALSNARLIEELDRLSWGTLTALARAIDAKSHWTMGHSERVTAMALRIGRAMDLTEEELAVLHQGSLLHDIGKIGITSKMLDKPARLSEAEMDVVRGHVEMGARILEPVPALADAVPIVLQHHEQYDGKGYPEGLVGEEIHLGARILMVADYYDAMRSARPYRPPGDRQEVVDSIAREAGKKFDPKVVGIFLQLIREEEDAGLDKKNRAAWSGSSVLSSS